MATFLHGSMLLAARPPASCPFERHVFHYADYA
jgi:hypothetical protein